MATNRFLVVAKYAVGSNRGLKDVDLVDTRVRGGGIKDDLIETFKGSYPQVRWFHDIGHYDGTPFPGATATLVDLPASILESNGGILTKAQVDSIVKHHLSFGVYPVIRFYCTNTGLVKHESVPGWDVEEGLTCPRPDGEVICTAPEFFDGFTGVDGDAPDDTYWDVSVSGTSVVEIQDNQLDMYCGPVGGVPPAGDYAYCDFIPGITGDVDVQFDYEIEDGPNEDFWGIQFLVLDKIHYTSLTFIRGYYNDFAPTIDVEGHQYNSYMYDPSTGYSYEGEELTEHSSGKMRITRIDNIWTSYYWDGTEWVENYSFTQTEVTTNEVGVYVRLRHGLSDFPGGNPAAPAATVRIDNFRVNSGTLV